MRKVVFALLAILALSDVRSSRAASQMITGRITYIDVAKREFMLDNAYMYAAAPSVNLAALAIADRVSLVVAKKQSREIANKVIQVNPSD